MGKNWSKAVLSMLVVLVGSSGCTSWGGDGGLVPAVLGLKPPSQTTSEVPTAASNASDTGPPLRMAPEQSAPLVSAERDKAPAVSATRRNVSDEPSVEERLRALKRLNDRGLLSDAEYQHRRQRLLERN